jgi:hypothetical protein
MITDPTDPCAGSTTPPPSPNDPGDAQTQAWADVMLGIWDRLTNPLPRTT